MYTINRNYYLILFVLTVLLFLNITANSGMAVSNALTISGTGLHKDLTIDDWSKYTTVERYYSSNNNFDFHKIWVVKGYDLFELIGVDNLKKDRDYEITFIASDGVQITRTVSQLKNLYYYPDLTVNSEQLVLPMIGFRRAELYDHLGYPGKISWEKRALTDSDRDDRAPRLYLGQQKGNISDKNQQFFIRNLITIVVGEERGTEPDIAVGDSDNDSEAQQEQETNNDGDITNESGELEEEQADNDLEHIDNDEEDDEDGLPNIEKDTGKGLPEKEVLIAEETAEISQQGNTTEFGYVSEASYLWIVFAVVGLIVLLLIINLYFKRKRNI